MELQHPIDAAIRARLREMAPHQSSLAATIGRSQGWLNKFMNGGGNATIDDLVRIAAVFVGVAVQPINEPERRLLRAFRKVRADRQEDAVLVFENIAKGYRTERPQESIAREAHMPPATSRKARGRQRVGKE